MLVLKEITKDYKTAGSIVPALKGVSLAFRKNEFVSILGASGCGKTTLLNIIGGLDHYTSGDLIINGKSTKDYKDHDWDVYRNHRIGFVFQSYNLIPHQTVLGNVEIALTIAGISKAERRRRAEEVLEKVGLKAEMKKRPNQLSGGQMQRVAIARALVNNPEILLADEPTGALDTTTSVEIMELIKEIAGERLVIMVTHNPELAEQYSTRIVRLQDGLVISDSNPFDLDEAESTEETPVSVLPETVEETVEEVVEETPAPVVIKRKRKEKSSMSFGTSLGLSARNLASKKGRTSVTAIAGSIGIISVCLVLGLSNGFNNFILKTEEDMLSNYPIKMSETTVDVEAIMSGFTASSDMPDLDKIGDRAYVNSFITSIGKGMQVTNNLSDEYISYVTGMPQNYYTAIQFDYGEVLSDNLFTNVAQVDKDGNPTADRYYSLTQTRNAYIAQLESLGGQNAQFAQLAPMLTMLGEVVTKMPGTADFNDPRYSQYVLSQYEVIAKNETSETGFPTQANEAVLVIGSNNDITDITLGQLGMITPEEFMAYFDMTQEGNELTEEEYERLHFLAFERLLSKEYVLYYNDAIYKEVAGYTGAVGEYPFEYVPERSSLAVSEDEGIPIKITGILRLKEGLSYGCLSNGLNLTEKLVEDYIEKNAQSKIVKWMTDETPQTQGLNRILAGGYTFFRSPSKNLSDAGYYKENADLPSPLSRFELSYALKTPLRAIGGVKSVEEIRVFTETFETKQAILAHLDAWNELYENEEEKQVKYTDTVGMMMDMMQMMLDAITVVLVAFTSISLIVSSVMIGIITYVSVVERVKEIGVLRSLGASKRNIKNLFNAETFIIGLASGTFGVAVTYLLSLGINLLMKFATGITGLMALPFTSALVMIAISITLTLISGLIPAKAAAKKDPVVALRTE